MKSPSVMAPAVELNCVALLIVMMAVPGVDTLKSGRRAGDGRGEAAQRQQRGVVEQGQVDAADVLAGAERDRQARGGRGGDVDRLAIAAGEVGDADDHRVARQGVDGERGREVVARGAVADAVEQGAGGALEGVRPADQGDRVGVGREEAGGLDERDRLAVRADDQRPGDGAGGLADEGGVGGPMVPGVVEVEDAGVHRRVERDGEAGGRRRQAVASRSVEATVHWSPKLMPLTVWLARGHATNSA